MKANISGAGKGSATRPVDAKKFGDNYDKIFGKKDVDNGAEVATTFPATLKGDRDVTRPASDMRPSS